MQKLNITKEDFIEILNCYRKQKEKIEKFNDALDKMCDGYIVFDSNNGYLEALLFTLSKTFYQEPNSEFNTIDWYLFECTNKDNEHIMFQDGYELNINTDELCYELLCAEFEQKANNNDEAMKQLFKTKGTPITEEEYLRKHKITPVNLVKNLTQDEVLELAKENYINHLKENENDG